MLRRTIACAVAAVLTVIAGCGEPDGGLVGFGAAAAERKAQFVHAVAAALRGFEDLDGRGVEISVSSNDVPPLVTVRGSNMPQAELGKALGVALTNMAFKYPGIGFMSTGDGGWRILMPDEMRIPVTGDFGLEFK